MSNCFEQKSATIQVHLGCGPFPMILLMEDILDLLGCIKNTVNNGIFTISTGAGFLLSTVVVNEDLEGSPNEHLLNPGGDWHPGRGTHSRYPTSSVQKMHPIHIDELKWFVIVG